jgi:nucleoside-diphosphate-sugar epimerase
MIQKNKIGIIGCGWLGLPLAKLLLQNKYSVKGSTTSKEKLQILQNQKINPYLIEIKENEIKGDIDSFMSGLDILIINIPPKMKSNPNGKYSKKIESLNSFIKSKSINKILFISSTSVYGSNQGKVDSNTVPIPNSENGLEILKSEEILNKNKNCTIIRFGGLIGKNRHPVYFLSKKKQSFKPSSTNKFNTLRGLYTNHLFYN